MGIIRIRELDGLRGIAAICVVLYHYTSRFSVKFDTTIITSNFNFKYGYLGVELFFIISGFVIFMSIEHINSPLEFIYKRFVRLYPTFWICMIFTYFFTVFFGHEMLKVSLKEFVLNFTMLPDLFSAKAVDGVYWTLKVEMTFYLLILLLLVTRIEKKNMYLGFGFLFLGIVSVVFFRFTLYYYYGLLFLIGINFYQIWKFKAKWWNHLQILLCLVLTILSNKEILIIISVVLLIVFYLMVYGKIKFLAHPILLFLGKISYALYLIHQNIGYTIMLKMISIGVNNFVILLAIPLVVSLLLASFITLYIEKPIMYRLLNFTK